MTETLQHVQMAAAARAAEFFRGWIVEKALPLWSGVGFDASAGLFEERLDFSGAPVSVPRRSMVQARQTYVFAEAARLGWFPRGAALAETAINSLLAAYRESADPRGGYAFSLGPDGRIADAARDAYAHAFILFAFAAVYRLNGDPRMLREADATIEFIEAALADRTHGGLYDSVSAADRAKRQNPHMHLLEAYLALAEAAPGRGYLERAGALVRLFRERLFLDDPGVLLEYFAEDWGDHPDPKKRGVFEPGHHFEWAWLLTQYEQLSGADLLAPILQLHQSASRRGIAPDGMLVNEISADMIVRDESHRIWPHCEAVKAAAAMAGRRDEGAASLAASMIGALAATFLDRPFAGGWIDRVGPDGRLQVDHVPASSLYHLFFAAVEAQRAFAPQVTSS